MAMAPRTTKRYSFDIALKAVITEAATNNARHARKMDLTPFIGERGEKKNICFSFLSISIPSFYLNYNTYEKFLKAPQTKSPR